MKIMVVDNEAFNLDFVQVVQKTVVQKLTSDYKMETKPAVRIYTNRSRDSLIMSLIPKRKGTRSLTTSLTKWKRRRSNDRRAAQGNESR